MKFKISNNNVMKGYLMIACTHVRAVCGKSYSEGSEGSQSKNAACTHAVFQFKVADTDGDGRNFCTHTHIHTQTFCVRLVERVRVHVSIRVRVCVVWQRTYQRMRTLTVISLDELRAALPTWSEDQVLECCVSSPAAAACGGERLIANMSCVFCTVC
jgi:hypothetical protein